MRAPASLGAIIVVANSLFGNRIDLWMLGDKIRIHNDRFDMKCVKANLLLEMAYNVRGFQIVGGPKWITSTQYNIAVKTESPSNGNTTPDKDVALLTDDERRTNGQRLREMLRSLLEDRFKLAVHNETREQTVLLLKVAKGGPKLKEISSDISGGLRAGRGFLAGTQIGIPFLAQTLSQIVVQPILDQTGLTGKYDLGAATLERRSRQGIGGAGPVRCGIPSSDQNPLTDRWLGVGRGLQPFAQSIACRSVPFDL